MAGLDPRYRDILRRDLRGGAPRGRRRRLDRGPRDPLAGRASRLRRSGARAGEPGARPHHRLGGGPRARRRGDRPRPGRRRRRDRRSRPGRRPPRRRHLRQDARLQPRSPAAGRESPRRTSLRADARRPRPGAAVRGPAGERRAHHAARRAGLGRVPAAGADARRRRRRGVRQGGQAAGARLSRRSGDRAAGEGGGSRPLRLSPSHAPGSRARGTQPLRLLLQRAQDRGAAGGASRRRPRPARPSRRRSASGRTWLADFRTRRSTCWWRRRRTRSRRSATAPR